MVEIKSKNLEDVLKKLSLLRIAFTDMSQVFKDIADLELSQTKQRFVQQVDPDGKKWPTPFTLRKGTGPETANGPQRSGYTSQQRWNYVVASNHHATPPGFRFFSSSRGDKILRDTGRLFNSIGRSYGKDFAVVGTNVEYAKKHQDGEGVRKRAFLGITQKTVQNIEDVINQWLGNKK